jgi:TrmH family RNA methyltransferase
MSLVIASCQNRLVKLTFKLLSEKKYRDQTGLFVAESFRLVKTLLENQLVCQNILVVENSPYISQLNKLVNPNTISIITTKVANAVSSLRSPEGILGVFKKNKLSFSINHQTGAYLILDKVQNPLNLGNILRIGSAFDIDGVFLTSSNVDIFHPGVLRASMGASVLLPINFSTSLTDVIKRLHEFEYVCYATGMASNAIPLKAIDFKTKSAILFGNEGNGLKPKDMKLCDQIITIPINYHKIDSLNIASAVAIITFQLKNTT